jgi:hypothetical protein
MPLQPAEKNAVITTTPGARNSMYESLANPGMSTVRSNRAPNRSSQITGCTSVTKIHAGWRHSARR